ncbi:MAG: hypothetical protein IRZ08_16885 [Frankia sp.]|nr:hypothetical protein [Frankia sp.]
MFDRLAARPRTTRSARVAHGDYARQEHRLPARLGTDHAERPAATAAPALPPGVAAAAAPSLPPSVARVAARTRLSAELLAALIAVEGRTRPTLDDMERADALADVLLARRRQRARRYRPELATTGRAG